MDINELQRTPPENHYLKTEIPENRKNFSDSSIADLSRMSGVGSAQWCRWFKGVGASEGSLIKAAIAFDVTPGTLLDWIIDRRNSDRNDLDSSRSSKKSKRKRR